MKLTIKDKGLEEDLSYYIYDLSVGWRGKKRNPFLDPRPTPTPFFEAIFRFRYSNKKEIEKFTRLLRNLTISGNYIDEILIEKEFGYDSLYEKVYIQSFSYGEKINPNAWEFNVHFEALKLTPVLTPEEERICDALTLIHTGELWIGVKK